MATAKKKAAPAPEPATEDGTQALGSAWIFPATERTSITRPDGAVVDVDPNVDGEIVHVLNVLGDYTAPGRSIVAR